MTKAATTTQRSVQQWLQTLHTSGHTLSLKELTYYKAKTHLLDLPIRQKVRSHLGGQYLAPHKGRGMEFAEVRHYQQGDDVRSIDWRVTARTGEAHTKLFQEEKERPVLLLVDLSATMHFGSQFLFKSVQAAHVAALVAWAACQRGDKLGALLFNDTQHVEHRPQSRDKAVLRIFHTMQDLHEKPPTQARPMLFAEQLKRLNQLAKPGSLVYVISDFSALNQQHEGIAKELQHLARHCEVNACVVSDPFEQALPAHAQSVVANTGAHKQLLPLHSSQFRKQYQRWAQANNNAQHALLARHCHGVVDISSDKPLEQQLVVGTRHAS